MQRLVVVTDDCFVFEKFWIFVKLKTGFEVLKKFFLVVMVKLIAFSAAWKIKKVMGSVETDLYK